MQAGKQAGQAGEQASGQASRPSGRACKRASKPAKRAQAGEQIKTWWSVLPLIVRAVDVDAIGGFVVTLSDGYALQVFPSHHHGAEYWRLFASDLESRHFVVTGQGGEAEVLRGP
jgi:hypothetical protein